MPKSFHVDSIQHWEPFNHDGISYDLGHLDSHEVVFQKDGEPISFVVTYGLHCFTKDDTEHTIPLKYADGRESQFICMECVFHGHPATDSMNIRPPIPR
ncbi:hypothetical protein PS928_06636 [Pseudomonas fluorescens]|uniref:Uncharacterized protein n=1 Tax=Pseudomonas fluorescens TaxID=294 RepID=A0A5E7VUW9_PSEFL|nr:hypothetical protein PS928_06636 [Pseudomonas fluorescens]